MNQRTLILIVAVIMTLSACAAPPLHQEGKTLINAGRVEDGLRVLARAVEADPRNLEARRELIMRRTAYVAQSLHSATTLRLAGKLDEAEAVLQRVLTVEAGQARALAALEDMARERRHVNLLVAARAALAAGDGERALATLQPLRSENPGDARLRDLQRDIETLQAQRQTLPNLKGSSSRPVNLTFRDANVRLIFEVLSRTSGINFILDKDVRPDLRTTVFLRNTGIDDAIDLIVQTSQLQRKILNSNTVLIYPGSPEKIKEYQDLLVKGFYLQNADVKQVQNALKSVLKLNTMVIDEKLRLITIRDTPEAIRLAEKVVALHDLAEPEVMLEVEVLEVQRSRLLDLGIQWPSQLSLTPLATGAGGRLTLHDLRGLNSRRLGVALSDTVLSAQSDKLDSNLLANPRIRVKNHDKARVLIGDRVPVITATTTATGIVSDSVQYLDVGLKLEVEPDVFLQDDVAIKIGLEVSSIIKQITTANGTQAYQIGTRNANTVLRLKDGETQILAGLINDQDRVGSSGIPGLADLPVLGHLFAGRQTNRDKTEIVLSITPRILRNVQRPAAAAMEFWSGTENTLRTRPMLLVAEEAGAPAGVAAQRATGATSAVGPASAANAAPAASAAPAVHANTSPSAGAPAPAPGAAAAPAILSWQGPAQVPVGALFKLTLRLKSDRALSGLPLQMSFDNAALQVIDVAEGGFFKKNGGASNFSSHVDVAAARVYLSALRAEVDGVMGEESAAVITFRALAPKSNAEVRLLSAAPLAQGTLPALLAPPPFQIEIKP